MSYHEQVLN